MEALYHKRGFSLVETVVAMSIFVISIALVIGGYMYMQRIRVDQVAQDSLDSDLGLSVQRLQQEMRLSSLSEMVFYPFDSTRYTAVSFPLVNKTRLSSGSESNMWASTVIYHMYGSGADQQLLRTEFTPRDNSLSAAERKLQLATVVSDGNGASALNGENAHTTQLFQHVFDWSIVPQGSAYDGYSPSLLRDRLASLGSCILSPGNHVLQFSVTGKADASSGYSIGFDTLRASTCGIEREAEIQEASGSPQPYVEYNSSGTWSGYHQLTFDANAIGDVCEIDVYNDEWVDTNFDLSGCIKSNVTVGTPDKNYSPVDLVLHLDGNSTNWTVQSQTGDSGGVDWAANVFQGAIVRVLLRGGSMTSGESLEHNGARCRLAFTASGSEDLVIEEAYIDEVINSADPTPDTVGNPVQLSFGSSDSCLISAGSSVWSDYADFPIAYDRSYAVTFRISSDAALCRPRLWLDQKHVTGSFMLHSSVGPTDDDLVLAAWSGRDEGGVTPLDAVVAVTALHTTYPEHGVFVSAVIDTQMTAPQYDAIDWNEDCPSSTSVDIRVRSSDSADMTDAPSWQSLSSIPSPGVMSSIDYKRYVQYQATLNSTGGMVTPKLRDVTIRWPGETRVVDIGGIFVNGPGYGQFVATVDGQPLSSPLRVTLTLQEDVSGMNNVAKTVYSTSVFELSPRNSGK
ncbi:MAG: prepilin-type N-terminal cleavage/methylation domain-containing protein [Pontiellaceae bacterium]|nr:prepilin-type N-terminal cleavage/methylation domain-containing protein [Pontiellaceae bacterium]MBN2786067.1 prepilin-type N-terminal cleavage/methylation domain-containing protein [Pontiellaceae bacterium]